MDISFDDIKQILAATAMAQQEQALQLAELNKLFATNRELAAADKVEFDQRIAAEKADLDQRLAAEKADLDQRLAAEKADLDKRMAAERADLDRTIKQTNKQLGELGNKLGSYTQGLSWPAIERILLEALGMDVVGQGIQVKKDGKQIELDVFGYANGDKNRCVVAEVKSHFRNEHVLQIETACEKIHEFMPEHRNKKVHGMIVFVKGDPQAIERAIKRGIYIVQADDENFSLLFSKEFAARDFGKQVG